MEFTMHNLFEIPIDDNKNYIIFGFGMAGQAIAWYLTHIKHIRKLCFCDNNKEKHNTEVYPPIYSLEETSKRLESYYIVGFMQNDKEKIKSSLCALDNLGINQNYIVVDMSKETYFRLQERYVENYIETLKRHQRTKEKIEQVNKVVFLSDGFNEEAEQIGGGGPIGAICMQKRYFGEKYKDLSLEYPYYAEQPTPEKLGERFGFIIQNYGAVKNIIDKEEKGTIYITNDIFSAFSLNILGKKYCLIYHGQGDIVQESFCRGGSFSDKENKIIQDIERIALEGAHGVFFPSIGASKYFEQCFEEPIEYNKGEPLYNAIFDFPKETPLPAIEKKEDCVTFLSIGQMTLLKGMDQIPKFICQYVEKTQMKVRWIVVASGVMKKDIDVEMNKIIERYPSLIEYVNIDYKLAHSEIFYLMSICDVYLMLHRVSIFDFSTLEAMFYGKPIILSNIPGNDEYNVENNILLVKAGDIDVKRVHEYILQKELHGEKNKKVYQRHFCGKKFIERYSTMVEAFIKHINSEEENNEKNISNSSCIQC